MNNNIQVQQSANLSGSVNQIGVQNNYGLTINDAMETLCRMFHEYYPQLREDIFSQFKKEFVQKLTQIASENLMPAPLNIAIRTMFDASITEEESIRELYTNLLASSMNKEMKGKVHPGYCSIIEQLSPDEAKIMRHIAEKGSIPTLSLFHSANPNGTECIIRNFSDVGELTGCDYPLEVSRYFDNLKRLGLIEIPDSFPGFIHALDDNAIYENLKNNPYILSECNELNSRKGKGRLLEEVEGYVSITDYGRGFFSVCIGTQNS